MSVKVRFALVFCVLLLVLVDCCQASGGQDGNEEFLEYLLLLFAGLPLALPSLLIPLYSKQLRLYSSINTLELQRSALLTPY